MNERMRPATQRPDVLVVPVDDLKATATRLAKYFDPQDLYRAMLRARLDSPVLRRPNVMYNTDGREESKDGE